MRKNQDILRCFINFRISSHQLAIEVGRYKKITVQERKCEICKSDDIEDEFHFTFECQAYNEYREQFIKAVEKKCQNFSTLSNRDKFIWLMANENNTIIKEFSNYIYKCFVLSKSLK